MRQTLTSNQEYADVESRVLRLATGVVMTRPTIKLADRSDYPGIAEIAARHRRSGADYYQAPLPDDPREIEETESQIFLVAKLDGRSVGYLWLHSDGSLQSNDDHAQPIIVVDPDYTRKGIGSSLLERAIDISSTKTKIGQLRANIKRGNSAAEKMCAKAGFVMRHQGDRGSMWALNIEH